MNVIHQNAKYNKQFVYKNDLFENKIYIKILANFLVDFVIFVDYKDYLHFQYFLNQDH